MKLPTFDYAAPDSIDAALSLLHEHGDEGKVLAGGQSLMPLMALRLARPSIIIDLNRLDGLSAVAVTDGRLSIGAMVRERVAERSEAVRTHAALLADALPLIGHAAIRNRGTVGGSLAHGDPAAELPAVAVALDAELVAQSAARGVRAIPAGDFFQGHFTTALQADELLIETRLPLQAGRTGTCFEEAVRRHGDFAMVGVAATVRIDGDTTDRIAAARIVLTGVASTPVRAIEAEGVLAGVGPTDEAFREAAMRATRDLDPPSDLHGSAAYRKKVAATLVRRALQRAWQRAGGEQ